MPQGPGLVPIPQFPESMKRYLNENFQRLNQAIVSVLNNISTIETNISNNDTDIANLEDLWASYRQPKSARQNSAFTSTSTSQADIPGTSMSVIPTENNSIGVFMGIVDYDGSAAGTLGIVELDINSSRKTGQIIGQGTERKAIAQCWVVDLGSAGTKTCKLVGWNNTATGTFTSSAPHTGLHLVHLFGAKT